MKKILFFMLLAGASLSAQPSIPRSGAEDVKGVMSPAYWAIWSDQEQARIDADIERYRKADATFRTGRIRKGTEVKVEQLSSDFVFGASAFNWNQLGDNASNARYRDLFGGLFNRATIPFYWRDFEPLPGLLRFKERLVDTEPFWNTVKRPTLQPHWRRPATDPIVDWCEAHGVAVHGHPLVWGSRKGQFPSWLLTEGVPETERRALDSLEMLLFLSRSSHVPAYEQMSAKELADLLPAYLKNVENRTYDRIRTLMTHYGDRIGSWDVVNESSRDFPLGVQDPSLPMCKSYYGPTFSDYVWRSFREAARYDSDNILLNINDYIVDDRYVQQVRSLLGRGARIEVIGSQMHLFDPQQCLDIAAGKHLDASSKLVDPETVRQYFGQLGSFGIPTCLSEITITSAGNGERGEMIQAIITRNLYRLWFSLPSMMGITWWNIVDDCGYAGEPNISGLFHRDMTPKTSYYALDQLLNHEWRTSLALKPDARGNISWRGFKGRYRIRWTDAKGREHEEMLHVQ